jgi:signal peptidase I
VGDHLLGNKFVYGLKWPFTHSYIFKGADPARGDIIIFEYPKDPDVDYIKRIVGLPGDVIELREKQLFRNGAKVEEPFAQYIATIAQDPRCINFGPVTVPENHYFVMGDNRDNSLDSRFWGFVKREAIRAKAWRIYWSSDGTDFRFSRIGRLVE